LANETPVVAAGEYSEGGATKGWELAQVLPFANNDVCTVFARRLE
jgi:hypothetical protein